MKSIPITFILTISLVSGFASATIIYVTPNYPLEALKNCIEGWVGFELTVMPGGFFENVKIIDSYPEGAFDEAARKALIRYKLVPKELIGVTTPVHGMKLKISYNLDGKCIQK
ncbi:energy transducer TonB [Microbulbifer sp. TRSA002]|uniref:energy transducer TonB n=1 Tax=Microbulbifer sp. TRSA002 TaxID=3243382 RepID=UPI004039FDFF